MFKAKSPLTKIIGVEPAGAPSMKISLENKTIHDCKQIDKFVDGAAVQRVGDLSYEICEELLDDCITVAEGRICQEILDLYNKEGIVAEPAGALAIAALEQYASTLKESKLQYLCVGEITILPVLQK